MRNLPRIALGALIAVAAAAAPACECRDKGAFEKMGEEIDQAGEEAREAVTGEDDRLDDVLDEARDVGEEIREKASD